ncbi:MAG: hypothetical protein R6V41_05630 [Desulfobacteraceae bacterium]
MKKNVLWILQPNQTTPTILEFLELLKNRVRSHAEIKFVIPEHSKEMMDAAKTLNPLPFTISSRAARQSYNAYLAKKDLLKEGSFSDGLAISDTLLLDDFAGGNARQTSVSFSGANHIRAIVLQIPTPLGSSATEEEVFHASIQWAAKHGIPALGYELLPLDTSWKLAASLPDGVITRNRSSLVRLKSQLNHRNIWQLPWYEASIFSPVSDGFNIKGAKASYHHINNLSIPFDRTILYIPHNVAMTHEYYTLLKMLQPFGEKLHLMFSTGTDQVRGGHSHKSIIETTCKTVLEKFASHSFHQANYTWELFMADCVVACSKCIYTLTASEKGIPWVVFDPGAETADEPENEIAADEGMLLSAIQKTINRHSDQRDLGNILLQMLNSQRNF